MNFLKRKISIFMPVAPKYQAEEEEIKKAYETDELFENSYSRTGHLVAMTEQEMCYCTERSFFSSSVPLLGQGFLQVCRQEKEPFKV